MVNTANSLATPGLAKPDRQLNIGEPEITLGDLTGGIDRPARRDPAADTPDATPPPGHSTCGSRRPADPFRDHRRRHPQNARSSSRSAARNHPPVTPTAPAHTSVDRRSPTPPSPCSANN